MPTAVDAAQVTFNGIALNQGLDANGVDWRCSGFDGRGRPAPTGGVNQRVGMTGGTNPRQWDGPQVMTITGSILAPTRALRLAAEQQLNGAVSNELFAVILNDGGTWQRMARRNNGVDLGDVTDTLSTFSIELIAPDPRWYALASTSTQIYVPSYSAGGGLTVPFTVPFTIPSSVPGGGVVVTNSGNAHTAPVLTIPGPVTNPHITNVTRLQTWTWNGTLATGDTLVVDMGARTATYNGADRSGLWSGSWWTLAAGDNNIQYRADSGGGNPLTITWTSARW